MTDSRVPTLSFNQGRPPMEGPAHATIEIGWEHTVDDDGNLTYLRDDDGNRIPRRHRIPMRLTPRETFERLANLDVEAFAQMMTHGWVGFLDMVNALAGDDVVATIALDPTVASDELGELVLHLVDRYQVDRLLGAADPSGN